MPASLLSNLWIFLAHGSLAQLHGQKQFWHPLVVRMRWRPCPNIWQINAMCDPSTSPGVGLVGKLTQLRYRCGFGKHDASVKPCLNHCITISRAWEKTPLPLGSTHWNTEWNRSPRYSNFLRMVWEGKIKLDMYSHSYTQPHTQIHIYIHIHTELHKTQSYTLTITHVHSYTQPHIFTVKHIRTVTETRT